MSFASAKNTAVLVDGSDLSSYFDSADTDIKLAALETTTFQSGAKTFVAGLLDASISLAGIFDGSANAVDQILQAALAGGADHVITICPVGDQAVGNAAKLCTALETDYKVSSAVAGIIKTSATIQPDGGAWGGVLLHPLIAETATGNSATVDNAISTANGAVANLHITGTSGTTPSLTVVVQHSADNTTWVNLISFNAATAAGAQNLAVTGTVNRYVRVQFTISGTTPSFTFALAFARK